MQSENLRQTFCRLCFCTTIETNFKVIEGVAREVIKVVFPGMDLEERDDHVMCRTCSIKLFTVLSFKSTCLGTEDVIFPYVTSEDMSVVDLKEIYLKEKIDNQKICRLCFELVTYGFVSLNEVDIDIINKYMPQVNINATKDPVICGLCSDSLRVYGSFVKNCVDAQGQYMQNYIKTEEIVIKAEESDQAGDSSSHDLLECTIRSSKQKYISGDSGKTMHECMRQVEINGSKSNTQKTEASLDTPSSKGEEKSKFKNSLKHKVASDLTKKSTNVTITSSCIIPKNPSDEYGKCGFQAQDKSSLTSHKLKYEDVSKSQMLKCDVCNYQSKYKKRLILHQLKHRDSIKMHIYNCDTCSYVSKFKYNMKIHQLTHKDLSECQTFKCTLCRYETRYKKCLVRHQLLHKNPSEIQMHKCDVCRYETKRKDCLKNHRLIHRKPPKA